MNGMKQSPRLLALLAAAACGGMALAATTVTRNGAELTYDVPAGESHELDEAFPAEAQTIVKTGAGTLLVGHANDERTGLVIDIRGGYVKTALDARPFGKGDTVKVAPGAALWYAGSPSSLDTQVFSTVEVAGDGPQHEGAFYCTSPTGADIMITTLKVGAGGAKIGGTGRFGASVTDLNGQALTNAFSNAERPYMFRTYEWMDWVPRTKVVNPGDVVQLSKKVIFQMPTAEGLAAVDPERNTWTVGTTAELQVSDARADAVFPWAIKADGDLTFSFSGAAAALNGPVVGVSDGRQLTLTGTREGPQTLAVNGDITNVVLKVDKPDLSVKMKDADLQCRSVDMSKGGSLEVDGGRSHRFARAWSFARLKNGARLSFRNAGTVWMPNGLVDCGNSDFASGHGVSALEFAGATVLALTSTAYPNPGILVGAAWSDSSVGSAAGGWGALAVRDGATVTNGVVVGTSGVGALYLTEASLYAQGRELLVGAGAAGYGAVCASNASLVVRNGLRVGSGEGSVAHYVQLGGTGAHNRSPCALGGAAANFYLGAGASYDMRETFADPDGVSVFRFASGDETATSGESVLTCDGGATCRVSRVYVAAKANRTTQINMNDGGCFAGYQMWYSESHARAADTTFRLSFNGGTLSYPYTWESAPTFLSDAPDRMVVHAGGATVHVAANTTLRSHGAFVRPRGRSVKAIAPPTDADYLAATNVGPARVVFEGPGEGMTAFVSFDDRRGQLGDVVVTSPGEGCDEQTRAYVELPQYPGRRFACGLELQEETGGDLVKEGDGTFRLDSTNTYAGATVVRGGALAAACDWALPSNTAVRIESGSLYLNYTKAWLKTLEGCGGSISGISGHVLPVERLSTFGLNGVAFPSEARLSVTGAWTVDADELIANKAAGKVPNYAVRVEFGERATIAFTGLERLDPKLSPYPVCAFEGGSRTGVPQLTGEPLPAMWRFKVKKGIISLSRQHGTVLIMR